MDLIKENITPAEDEQSVRTYCCTYYKSRLLGIETNGFLGVTNKRVIFQATGASASGRSVIQSEVPIADISGITSFKGPFFSIPAMLGAIILSFLLGSITMALLTAIAAWSDSKSVFDILGWVTVAGAFFGSFYVPVKSIWRPVLVGIAAVVLAGLGGSSLLDSLSFFGMSQNGAEGWQFLLSAFMTIFGLLCAFWYARRPTFALQIGSKGGASTPISISSATGMGLLNISAAKSLNAEPAKDAESMLKELGALILDIQMLGDHGIEKWKTL